MKTVAAAIEFGTSKIITLIAESGSFTRCEIVGSGTVPYAGYANGEWNDRPGLLPAIEAAVQAAEVEAKRRIQSIFVGVPSEYIHVTTAIGETEITSPDGRVTEDEIMRVMDDAADQLNLLGQGCHLFRQRVQSEIVPGLLRDLPVYHFLLPGKQNAQLRLFHVRLLHFHFISFRIIADPFCPATVQIGRNSVNMSIYGCRLQQPAFLFFQFFPVFFQ